jgi:hypothetical protein
MEVGNRSGGSNSSMSDTSEILSKAVGVETGLTLLRIHTHPVLIGVIDKFPVGKEFPNLFINRKLFSTPQMAQQANVGPRMIDGRPTYFSTSIANKEMEDEDLRLSNESLAKVNPGSFLKASLGAAVVLPAVAGQHTLEPSEDFLIPAQ